MANFTSYIEFIEVIGLQATKLVNLPSRATSSRPISPDLYTGSLAFNTDSGLIEWYDGTSWQSPLVGTTTGFINNSTTLQTPANFNISGTGQLASLGAGMAPSSSYAGAFKAPTGSDEAAYFTADASFTGTSISISSVPFSGADRRAGIKLYSNSVQKWFVGAESVGSGLTPDFIFERSLITNSIPLKIIGNTGNIRISALSTGVTPPTTTGTTKMVITDIAGQLSFTNIPTTTYSDEQAQDAVGGILDASEFIYNDTGGNISINNISASKITTSTTRRFITDTQLLNFQDAYDNKIISLAFTGTTTKTLTLTQQDGGTITGTFDDTGGGGGSTVSHVKFHVGDIGYPANNATTYTNSLFIGKDILVYRENERMYEGDTSYGIDFDDVTGTITFYPSLDTGERIVVDIVDSLGTVPNVKNNIAFTTAIPFDYLITTIASHTVTAPITFTINSTGAEYGNGAMLRLVADGVNFPDFSAFKKLGANDYDNTAGIVNLLAFMYWGVEYTVSFGQPEDIVGVSQLATPGSFVANAISGSEIDLTWTDTNTSPNELNFEIQRGVLADYSDATTIFSPAANATSYNNTGLSPSTHYYYRIRAIGDGVTFLTSNWATANDTTDALPQLGTPTLTATTAGGTQINLSWGAVTSATNYVLDRATNAGFTTGVALGIYSGSGLSYNNTGLANSTHYYYRLRAQASGFTDSLYGTDDDTTTSGSLTIATAPHYLYRKVRPGTDTYQEMQDSTHVLKLKDVPHYTLAGNVYDLIASNDPANQAPVLVANGVDGNPAVRFGTDGNRKLYHSATTNYTYGEVVRWGIFRVEAVAPGSNQYFFLEGGASGHLDFGYLASTNRWFVYADGAFPLDPAAAPAPQANTTYFVAIRKKADKSISIFINGTWYLTNLADATGSTTFQGEGLGGAAGAEWLYFQGGTFRADYPNSGDPVITDTQVMELYNDAKTSEGFASLP